MLLASAGFLAEGLSAIGAALGGFALAWAWVALRGPRARVFARPWDRLASPWTQMVEEGPAQASSRENVAASLFAAASKATARRRQEKREAVARKAAEEQAAAAQQAAEAAAAHGAEAKEQEKLDERARAAKALAESKAKGEERRRKAAEMAREREQRGEFVSEEDRQRMEVCWRPARQTGRGGESQAQALCLISPHRWTRTKAGNVRRS